MSANYLFFDTETTGLPRNYNAPSSDTENWPRMVQISWIITDENGEEIKREDHIIKPEGYTIPTQASNIHRITTQRALKEGHPLKDVLDSFLTDVDNAQHLVCHNASFDKKIVGAELIRSFGYDDLQKRTFRCTMRESTNFCRLPFQRGGWGNAYKVPRLQELHNILFGCEFEDAHNSMSDVQATVKCFWKLKEIGVM
ncbi:MAG: 3'-5' exonuclease [Paludibacteraceae bacterium]|nr:3'-5' exonuclease [Paludibacteraceae bacterium]